MPQALLDRWLPVAAGAVCFALATWWLSSISGDDPSVRLPGQDSTPAHRATDSVKVTIGEPKPGAGRPSSATGSWPGFRGPSRDAVSTENVRLARQWPDGGPPRLWSIELAQGYAGAAVANGRVYVLDYDEQERADTLRCLSLDDGEEIWRNSYGVEVTRNHGITRSVPAFADGLVVTMGPRCHVVCWDADSGQSRWLIDLAAEHGATEPRWYSGQCPLIDDGRVILAPCGKAMLLAVDLQTGEVVWESPNPRGWEMSHVSIMPMEFAGRRSYLYCGTGGAAAVDTETGDLLWDFTEWRTTFATCPSPLALPDGRVFLCSGYGRTVGSLILQAEFAEGRFSVQTERRLTPEEFNSEHHTPILSDGRIYGVRKQGGGQLVCLDLDGKELWNSGSDRFGHGPYVLADGLIFVMNDRGRLTMVDASPDGYRRRGSAEVFPNGREAWGPMAIASGRLIVREMTRMACLDVSQR